MMIGEGFEGIESVCTGTWGVDLVPNLDYLLVKKRSSI
jgi:hypothetical protein